MGQSTNSDSNSTMKDRLSFIALIAKSLLLLTVFAGSILAMLFGKNAHVDGLTVVLVVILLMLMFLIGWNTVAQIKKRIAAE